MVIVFVSDLSFSYKKYNILLLGDNYEKHEDW